MGNVSEALAVSHVQPRTTVELDRFRNFCPEAVMRHSAG